MAIPQRIQLSRKKGFRLHEASKRLNGFPVMKVARPSKWENPFRVGRDGDAETCVRKFREYLRMGTGPDHDWLATLRGKNLACFCALDAPCHADVLLELANGNTAAVSHYS